MTKSGTWWKIFCSRQRSKSTQPPLALQATWGAMYRRKTPHDFFQIFGILLKEKREEGKLNWPATTTTRASRSEQWKACKPSTNRDHSRASRSEQRAAIEKGEGFYYFNLPQNSSSFKKLSVSVIMKTAQEIIYWTKISCSSSENQPLHKLAKWLSLCFLSVFSFFLLSRQGRKSSLCHVYISWTSVKRWWKASWSSSQFSLDVQTSSTPTHFNVVYDTTAFLTGTRNHVSGSLSREVNH